MAQAGWSVAPPSGSGFSQVAPHKWKPPKPRRPRTRVPTAPARPVQRPVYNPFAPRSDAELAALAASQAQGIYGPQAAAIQAAIEARSRSGIAAIGGLTNQLGGLWQGVAPATGEIYGKARAEQSQTNTDLANRLGSFGQGLQGELQGKLALQNAPGNVTEQVAGGAGQTAQGVANANYASGSAGMEALLAQGAAAQAYGAKLPGIAGLSGLQSGKQLEAQLNQSLADQLGKAGADQASNQSQIYLHLLDQELNKAVAEQSGIGKAATLAESKRYHESTLSYKIKKDARDRALKRVSLGISDKRLQEYMRHNGVNEATATARLTQEAQHNKQVQRNQNLRQNKWQVNPDGSFRTRINKKTGKKERIPLKGTGGSASGY